MVLHWYYILLFSLILVLHQEPKRPENPKNPQGFTNYKTTTVAVVILLQIYEKVIIFYIYKVNFRRVFVLCMKNILILQVKLLTIGIDFHVDVALI